MDTLDRCAKEILINKHFSTLPEGRGEGAIQISGGNLLPAKAEGAWHLPETGGRQRHAGRPEGVELRFFRSLIT